MKVVVCTPNCKPVTCDIENELEAMQEIVGGYIEVVPLKNNYLIVCNEEGKLMGLEPNVRYYNEMIVGTFFVVTEDENDPSEFRGLTDEEADFWESVFSI